MERKPSWLLQLVGRLEEGEGATRSHEENERIGCTVVNSGREAPVRMK